MISRFAFIAAALVCAASPASAAGFQYIVTFDDLALGTTSFTINNGLFDIHIAGGIVVTLDPAAAHSGTQGYSGTSISITTSTPADFSLPAVGAWVTAQTSVVLQAYEYDMATAGEVPLPAIASAAPATLDYLSVGSEAAPRFVTSAIFSVGRTEQFVMDDLTLGLENVIPGIPEPASWTMMLAGFGLIGTAWRRSARPACRVRLGQLSEPGEPCFA